MKILLLTFVAITLLSCTKFRQIGDLNMISTRNVPNENNYVSLATYVGTDKKEIKKNKSASVEEAVDKIVRKVPGGELLKNVKVYIVDGKYIAVSGDVWGEAGETGFRGFKVGDEVLFKYLGKYASGTVVSFTNSEKVLIKYIEMDNEVIKEMKIADIKKK